MTVYGISDLRHHLFREWLMLCLTHWDRVTHICVGKLTIIGSDNGLSPGRRQAIIWTNDGILLIGPLETNFSEILSEIQSFSFKKMHLKMLSGKWRPCCLGLNVLTPSHYLNQCWLVELTLRNRFQWIFKENTRFFNQENVFRNVIWQMAAIMSMPDSLCWSKWYPPTLTTNQFDRLMQERRNSSALAMELRLSCTNPLNLCAGIIGNIQQIYWE